MTDGTHVVSTLSSEIELLRAREAYQFNYAYEGLGFLKGRLNKSDTYSPKAFATLLGKQLWFLLNHSVARATPTGSDSHLRDAASLVEQVRGDLEQITALLAGKDTCESLLEAVLAHLLKHHADDDARPTSVNDYLHMFQLLDAPPSAKYWDEDWYFAYSMVTCIVPNHLVCIDALPENFPVTDAMYREATGDPGGLTAALAQRRVFLSDFSRYAGVSSTKKFGGALVTSAPMALFTWYEGEGDARFALRPVAIQCGQSPGPDTPIFTPKDRWHWKMARQCVRGALGLYSGTSVHFGTHLLMSRVVITTYRHLTTSHPVYQLLNPNFEFTLAVNYFTEKYSEPEFYPKFFESYLVGLMSPTREDSMALARDYVDNFRFDRSAPPQMFGERGLADSSVLPMYPFRDDTTRLWAAIRTFVGAYVDVYYAQDADVEHDRALQDWVSWLQNEGDEGGRLHGIGVQTAPDQPGVVHTKLALADLAAQIMYQASAYHAALNYSNFEFLSMPLVMSYSTFAGPPTPDTPNTEEAFMQRWPPMGYAWMQFHFTYIQFMLWENTLGVYKEGTFTNPEVVAAAQAFRRELEAAEAIIVAENQGRPVPYVYQVPSQVTASIHN